MLAAVREEAEERGFDVTCLSVSDLKVAPCTGCMVCRSRLSCVLPKDDAQRVLGLIEACDVLVVGAPCYWGNMPGQLKVLFDRIVYGMMGESASGIPKPLHKGKKAILVAACTTPFPFNILFGQSQGVVRALKRDSEVERIQGGGCSAAGRDEEASGHRKETPFLPQSFKKDIGCFRLIWSMEESGCRICCGRERFHTGIWPQARHSANPDKEKSVSPA